MSDEPLADPPAATGARRSTSPAVLAVLLYALLVDGAIETFWHASPMRWTFLGTLAAYALLTILLWRRLRWGGRLVATVAVLAATIDLAVVRYGSDVSALYFATLPLSRVVTFGMIVALVCSAWLLSRLASLRRRRWLLGAVFAVTIYALVPIGLAFARAASFAEAASGALMLGRVPLWLQGAYIGSQLLLPIGLIAALVLLIASVRRSALPARTAVASALVVLLAAFVAASADLSRARLPHLAGRAIDPLLAELASAHPPVASQAAPGSLRDAGAQIPWAGDEDWLKPYRALTLDQAFEFVATRLRYEPYRGALRGARWTLLAGGGNSIDKSLVLAAILRAGGHEIRFVRGVLTEPNLSATLGGLFPPPIPSLALSSDYRPYQLALDSALQAVAADHTWLEVNQGGTWLPLDPSFPQARIGQAYATPQERVPELPEADYQHVEIVLKVETARRGTEESGRVAGRVADLALRPISLLVSGVPLAGKDQAAPAPSAGDLFNGALSGEAAPPAGAAPKSPKPVAGIAYRRTLTVGSDVRPLRTTNVVADRPDTALRREWLEITITAPGGLRRIVERALEAQPQSAPFAAEHRRYTLVLVPGPLPERFADDQAARARTVVRLDDWQRDVTTIGERTQAPDANAGLERVRPIEASTGIEAGYLLALRFAAESDVLSTRLAYPSHVALVGGTPRILIASAETVGDTATTAHSTLSLDLRLDEVEAYPYPGASTRAARLFQTARGIQESFLEGAVLRRVGGEAATTATLIHAAEDAHIELLAVTPRHAADLDRANGLPASDRALIEASLRDGHQVVLPARAVPIAGRDRWGWWEIDPRSGAVVGVMHGGQHQGIVEYEVSLNEIGLHDETGFYLGCVVGATTTEIRVAAMMLAYGEVTPELIAEIKEYVENGACNSFCPPKLEVVAKGEVNVGEDCLKRDHLAIGGDEEWDIKPGAGLKVENKFCERYNDGFKCAGGIILAGLLGEKIGPGGKVEVNLALPNCKEYKMKLGYGNQAK